MTALQTAALVAIAGALGTLLRFGAGNGIARLTGGTFPWATLLINTLGCFAIGILAGALEQGSLIPPHWRTALTVGFIGGFTTYSTFAIDAFSLASRSGWTHAAAYVLLTNVIGLVAVWFGYRAGS